MIQPKQHKQRRTTMKVNAKTKETTAFESERIINNSLGWLLALMYSSKDAMEPEFNTATIVSLKCDCGDDTYETVMFNMNDTKQVLKDKIRRIVMNGWAVADFELDGRLALNFLYIEKFMHALGPYGGSFAIMHDGLAKFIPAADEKFYFWDVVFEGEPM